MLFIVFGLLAILIVIAVVFSFPQFSPVPYFPTNKKDLDLVLKALNLRDNQMVVDFGAGDGLIIFGAADYAVKKNLSTQFVAVEYNFLLVLVLFLRRFFHKNRHNIRIVWADMFKTSFRSEKPEIKTFYLYISPWFMTSMYKKLRREARSFELISYFYPVPNIKPLKTLRGKNNIYVYKR